MKRELTNKRGQAVIFAIIGMSIFLFTLFAFYTIYWQHSIASSVQIREAYNLMEATNEAAQQIQGWWDQAVAQSGYGAPLSTIQAAFAAIAFPAAGAACNTCPTVGAQPALCYPNPSDANNPYCFYNGGVTTAKLEFKLLMPKDKKPSFVERVVEKVALLGRHQWQFSFLDDTAFAGIPGPSRTDNLGQVPICPGDSSCMSCGNGNGAVCVSIYACPRVFLGCKNYDGTQASAIFAQQFYLIPPNASDK